ncbi:MAG: response regulator transcription factor [Alphaproteobacteria bacterium]
MMIAREPIIAIVDDDESVRRALRRLVHSLSYKSVEFASGEELLESFNGVEPLCVLMDLHLPGMKGLDVVVRMRSAGRAVPVIIITGFDQPGMYEKCLGAGAVGYLIKPLERSVVASAIETAIGSARERGES